MLDSCFDFPQWQTVTENQAKKKKSFPLLSCFLVVVFVTATELKLEQYASSEFFLISCENLEYTAKNPKDIKRSQAILWELVPELCED